MNGKINALLLVLQIAMLILMQMEVTLAFHALTNLTSSSDQANVSAKMVTLWSKSSAFPNMFQWRQFK